MQFTFTPMIETAIIEMQSWHFDEPYAVYNLPDNLESNRVEMMDQLSPYYAVHNEASQLVGYFCFGTSAEPWNHEVAALYSDDAIHTLTIGLGMRPDLTGQGMGSAFIASGLTFAREHFQPERFKLYVLGFNKRAIRAYERAGFIQIGTISQQRTTGTSTFLIMERLAL